MKKKSIFVLCLLAAYFTADAYALFRFRGPLRNQKTQDWIALRMAYINDYNEVNSVTDLTAWVGGTTNQVISTDDSDGSLTLSLPQDINTVSSPTFANLILADGGALKVADGSPMITLDDSNYVEIDGWVGIGINIPETSLHVQGAHVSGKGLVYVEGYTHAFLTVEAATGYDAGYLFREGSTNKWQLVLDTTDDNFKFMARDPGPDTFRWAIDQSGNVEQITGNLTLTVGSLITGGGRIINRTSVSSSPYAVLASDHHISVTTASVAITLNLPAIVDGTEYHIKDQDGNSAGKNITVSPNGSDTIENAASLVINTNGASITLVGNSTTTNWEVQ